MKRFGILTLTLLSALGLVMGPAVLTLAQSLYPVDQNSSMFADRKARRPGDLVTVIIVEQAQARQTAATSTGKDSEVSVGPGGACWPISFPCCAWAAATAFRGWVHYLGRQPNGQDHH